MDWLSLLPLAALVGILGWFVKDGLDRTERSRLKFEKTRDFQKAIFAEIKDYLLKLEQLETAKTLSEFGLSVADQIREKDFVPFVPVEKNDTVYTAILNELHILPIDVIDPVVRYYSQLQDISSLISDMRSKDFASLERDRRAEMYIHYIAMKIEAKKLGSVALMEIEKQPKVQILKRHLITGKWS